MQTTEAPMTESQFYGTASVWTVAVGWYADYHVVAIFSNGDAAERFKTQYEEAHANFIEFYGEDYVTVEEYPLGEKSSDIFGPFYVIVDLVLKDGTLGRYDEIGYGGERYGEALLKTGPLAGPSRHYFEPTGKYRTISDKAVMVRTVKRTEREARAAHNIALNQVQQQVTSDLFDWDSKIA